jgi:hypothetical protein
MELKAALQQMEDGKTYLIDKANQLSLQQEAFHQKISEKLNLGGLGNPLESKEGNDDILKINFAGENMDITRSVLTRSDFGWNLFSCLFEKRWDGFHVRDREGRIYVDLKGKWLKPLIYSFHQNDVKADIISPNLFTNRSIEMFNCGGEFGFLSPQIFGDIYKTTAYADQKLPHLITTFEKVSDHCAILLKSCDFFFFSPDDITYKPMVYLGKDSVQYAIISRLLQKPLHSNDELSLYVISENERKWKEEPVSNIVWDRKRDDFPKFQFTSANRTYSFKESRNIETFEINLLGNRIYPPQKPFETTENSVSVEQQCKTIQDDTARGFVQPYLLCVQSYDQKLKDVQYMTEQFSTEMDVMAKYFAQAWGLSVTAEGQTPEELLQYVREKKNVEGGLEANETKSFSSEDMASTPLVYFNVEGEIVPILRSTILRVIPQSQLAVRVSGRWQDQPSDIDEHGNLIVRCPKEAFKHILASLQVHNPTRKEDFPLEIFVNEYSKNTIEDTLDFLQITPHFIRFVDGEF